MLRANVVARRSRSREATAQQVRTKHARTAHGAQQSSIDEKGLIIKSKATSAPPRAGTTGISFLFIIWIMINTSSTYNISFMYSLHSLYNNTRVTCSSAPSSSWLGTCGLVSIHPVHRWSMAEGWKLHHSMQLGLHRDGLQCHLPLLHSVWNKHLFSAAQTSEFPTDPRGPRAQRNPAAKEARMAVDLGPRVNQLCQKETVEAPYCGCFEHINKRRCVCIYIYIFTYLYMFSFIYLFVIHWIDIYICIYIYIYTYYSIYVIVYVYIYMFIIVYICIISISLCIIIYHYIYIYISLKMIIYN